MLGVGVMVAVAVAVGVAVSVAVAVGVAVGGSGVGVSVAVAVGVTEGVSVAVAVGVAVGGFKAAQEVDSRMTKNKTDMRRMDVLTSIECKLTAKDTTRLLTGLCGKRALIQRCYPTILRCSSVAVGSGGRATWIRTV